VYSYAWQHHFSGWRNVSSCGSLLELCGDFHASELGFVWQAYLDSPLHTANDREMTAAIGTYWTNFAKTGDPNQKGVGAADVAGTTTADSVSGATYDVVFWPKFNRSDELFIQLQVPGLSVDAHRLQRQGDMFDELDGFVV
jgi:carboxylesterase type B